MQKECYWGPNSEFFTKGGLGFTCLCRLSCIYSIGFLNILVALQLFTKAQLWGLRACFWKIVAMFENQTVVRAKSKSIVRYCCNHPDVTGDLEVTMRNYKSVFSKKICEVIHTVLNILYFGTDISIWFFRFNILTTPCLTSSWASLWMPPVHFNIASHHQTIRCNAMLSIFELWLDSTPDQFLPNLNRECMFS